MTKEQLTICENQGWNVTEYEDCIEFEQESPAGEDFLFSVTVEEDSTLADEVYSYYMDFDADEHVEMWLEARHNRPNAGIPSARVLVEDADAIEQMLLTLAYALSDCERETRLAA